MEKDIIILNDLVITPLIKAKQALDIALSAPKTDLNRDASIQRFEFTFELTWKTLKRILQKKGIRIHNPRDVLREAAKEGFIEDPQIWFDFLENRNNTLHVYNEKTAETIYQALPAFKNALEALIEKILPL